MAKATLAKLRKVALANYLDVDSSDVKEGWEGELKVGTKTYRVLTEREAAKALWDRIADSLWAFNTNFLAHYLKVDYDSAVLILKPLQDRCENGNDAIRALITPSELKRLVKDAEAADKRGHFLSPYDGVEGRAIAGDRDFYIYRTN